MNGRTVRAAVTYEPFHSEVREIPFPDLPSDGGVLRVEAAGVCGSDIAAHSSKSAERILGHENIGVIEALGDVAAKRWGVKVGQRVVVEEYLPCGHCTTCRTTQFRFCAETDSRGVGIRYGSTALEVSPSLWGGYSQYLFLHPRTILHDAPAAVPAELLTLALPLGNGYEWAVVEGGCSTGKTVVVFGPGQQGLACVYAAKQAGADRVILFGLEHDAHRLEAATALGADHCFRLERCDPVEEVRKLTGGQLADIVIDTARGDVSTISAGIEMLKQCGQLLLATAENSTGTLPMRSAQWKCLTIRGVRGHSFGAVEWAISHLASDLDRLAPLSTHTFSLEEVDTAILATAGRASDSAIHVSVLPWI